MFGAAMSIFARSTQLPSSNSPRRMRVEQLQILCRGAIAVRAVLAGLGQRATVLANVVRVLVVDVRKPLLDELDGEIVNLLKVVGRVPQPIVPLEAEPPNIAFYALDELLRLALRVGVVETQKTGAAEILQPRRSPRR